MPSARAEGRGLRPRWPIAAALLAVVLAYLPSLQNGFVWDDLPHIVDNDAIRQWSDIPELLRRAEGLYYRPVVFVSYALELGLWGPNPSGFHFTNLVLHVLNTFLLYLLLQRFGSSRAAALSACALFGIHPMQTEAVAYVSGRTDPLVVASALLAWLILLQPWHAAQRGLIAALLTAVAIGSKESGYAVAVLVAWLAWRSGEGRNQRTLLAAPSLFVAIALAALRPGELPPQGEAGIVRVLAGAGSAIGTYVSVALWPAGLRVDRLTPGPTTAMETVAGLSILSAAVLLAVWGLTRRSVVSDWTLWTVTFYLPVSNLFVLYPAYFDQGLFTPEHNLYASSAGIVALLGLGADRLALFDNLARRRATTAVLIPILALSIVLTALRCRDWRDEHTLFASAAAAGSRSPRVWFNLGNSFLQRDSLAEAEDAFERGLSYAPNDPEIWMNLGVAKQRRNDWDGALYAYRKAAMLAPQNAAVFENLGTLFWARRDVESARRSFRRALQLDPQRDLARRALSAIDRGS